MHVRHRDDRGDADLKAALRAAEAEVKEKLGYTIALTEKPLFDPCSVNPNGAAVAAAAAAAAGASSSVQDPAPACGNKRSHLEIDDDDPELNDPALNAAMAEAERLS